MTRIYLSPPDMGPEERALLLDAFDSNWVAPLGPHVDAFEREFAVAVGSPDAAALSSGTAALHLALKLVGVGPGDRVYCPTFTFAATANAITYLGAEPVFLDSDEATWNLDPALLAETLDDDARSGRLPRAVVTVDLYGQCADHDAIVGACDRHDIPVIEDAAEALGATYRGRAAGTLGALGVFSFNGNKIITTSGGGMLVSRRRDRVARARHLASQAREATVDNHYHHTEIGHNYRMSNLLAAVGRGQLRGLMEKVDRRRAAFGRYERALGGIPGLRFQPEADYGRSSRWLTCIRVDPDEFGATREDIRRALEAADVESRPVWKPMHLQPAFAGCRSIDRGVAASIFEDGLCLPSGSSMNPEDQGRVIAIIAESARHG